MSDDSSPAVSESTGPGSTTQRSATEQRKVVRERYAEIATESDSCCGTADRSSGDAAETACCGDSQSEIAEQPAHEHRKGYAESDLEGPQAEANLGLGCGNPTGIASLSPGDTVLDLGSGAGFDCFLAAREVGESGRVIGVDMTPEMVERARETTEQNDAANVDFRLGEIEHLPVADGSVDVVISNCVVNLSPEKEQVFEEAYRVLRAGGRLAISDVVLTAELSADLQEDPSSLAGCVGGASSIPALESMLDEADFVNVTIEPKAESDEFIREWDDEHDLSDYIVSATIEAEKPGR